MNTQHIDPHAELKAACAAGRRIRVKTHFGSWGEWTLNGSWVWNRPPEDYEIEPLAADKWVAEKAAYAQGKKIEYKNHAGNWEPCLFPPVWSDEDEYRIAPEQPANVPTCFKTDEELGEIGRRRASEVQARIDGNELTDMAPHNVRDKPARTAFAAAVREAIFDGVEGIPTAEELHFCFKSFSGTIREAWECVHTFISTVFVEKTAELQRKLAEAEAKLTALSAKLELERQWRAAAEADLESVQRTKMNYANAIAALRKEADELANSRNACRLSEENLKAKIAAAEERLAEIAQLPERWRKAQEQRGLGLITVSGFAYELEKALKPAPSAEEIERREFEAMYLKNYPRCHQDLERNGGGEYIVASVRCGFAMWKAARAAKEGGV